MPLLLNRRTKQLPRRGGGISRQVTPGVAPGVGTWASGHAGGEGTASLPGQSGGMLRRLCASGHPQGVYACPAFSTGP